MAAGLLSNSLQTARSLTQVEPVPVASPAQVFASVRRLLHVDRAVEKDRLQCFTFRDFLHLTRYDYQCVGLGHRREDPRTLRTRY